MLIGSSAWQQAWESKREDWPVMLRDRLRAMAEERRSGGSGGWGLWRLSEWEQRDALSDDMVNWLELGSALQRLRQVDKRFYGVVSMVDLERPFAPVGQSGVPPECRRGYWMARASRRYGVSESTIDRWLKQAYWLLLDWVLDGDVRTQVRPEVP